MTILTRIPAAAVLLLGLVPSPTFASAQKPVDFNRDIRPLLSENCFQCHGPDEARRKSNLRLDQQDSATHPAKSGQTAIVPHDLAKSELVNRITTADEDDHMPPAKTGKKLSPAQIDLFRRWIDQGAVYSPHWGFVTPVRPPLPEINNKSWPRNDIDSFVLANLEDKNLSPSPEAPKATLIRRATLDLTGLPPTPEEVSAFLADQSPNAYEKVIDRLLASPRYGERMAMQWLDGARYADSNGYQADYERFQWPWRDWVINAFNSNKSYDQFTVEQIAGDLLPNATQDQKIATGFNRNHRINTEGGVIAEEWRVETVIDRVETTSAVWLGLTMGCCRCHDHKYDPISQKEFYQFFSFFNSIDETGSGQERPVNHPPILPLPRPGDKERLQEFDQKIAAAEKLLKDKTTSAANAHEDWEKTALSDSTAIAEWSPLTITDVKSAGGATFEKRDDKSILVTGPNPDTDTFTLTATTDLNDLAGLRLEALPDDSLPSKGPGRSRNGNVVLSEIKLQINGQPVKFKSAAADFSQEKFPVANAIDDNPATGWAIFPKIGVLHTATFALEKPIHADKPSTLTITLSFVPQFAQHVLGHFRLAVTSSKFPHGAGLPSNIIAALKTPTTQRLRYPEK